MSSTKILSLKDYLGFTKKVALEKLQTDGKSSFTFIIGNQAADLDSVVAAVTYGYFLYLKNLGEPGGNQESNFFIPIINCQRSELKFKTEVIWLFLQYGISLEEFALCWSDLDFISIATGSRFQNLRVILVDHNQLPTQQSFLIPFLIQVIDHHAITEGYKANPGRDKIEQVGSCCTLIAEALLAKEVSELLESTVWEMLHATILLDTINLSPSAGRTTPKDAIAIEKLETSLSRATRSTLTEASRSETYRNLLAAKTNIETFTVDELFKKDTKIIEDVQLGKLRIGIPAVPVLGKYFLKSPKCSTAVIQEFLHKNDIQLLVIMGYEISVETNEIQRDLLIYMEKQDDRCRKIVEKVVFALQKCDDLHLELIEKMESAVPTHQCSTLQHWLFKQNNVKLSRKFILPFVLQTLKKISEGSASPEDRASSSPTKASTTIPSISYDTLLLTATTSYGSNTTTSPATSSAYNSCPYTPANSTIEPSTPNTRQQNDYFLPTFNSRDMIEKIELKRYKLSVGGGLATTPTSTSFEDDLHRTMITYPFTPKNSYVDNYGREWLEEEFGGNSGGSNVQPQKPTTSVHQPIVVNAASPKKQPSTTVSATPIDSELLVKKLMQKKKEQDADFEDEENNFVG